MEVVKIVKVIAPALVFVAGAVVEWKTFQVTKNTSTSTGLGWGFLGAALLSDRLV
jgi:hypothetical protein